ncbi:hypothetical protein GGR13_001947 [Brevundimonas variabilis]|uniref:Microcin J25-processing protein McjB C-terminal domain-containing protein n=1 Tax=Brevundimonas variabilis TaxID=74312 RepID=A0A7W9CJ36_9CAUL|nr:hypothetical protein [Brevundimonas variabilis]
MALKVFPYRTIQRYMPRGGLTVAPRWRQVQIFSHVDWASRKVPGATCLPQALTGYLFLALLKLDCRIRIGVAKSAKGGFRAHATLMSGDAIILGDSPDRDEFVTLTELRPGQ